MLQKPKKKGNYNSPHASAFQEQNQYIESILAEFL